MNNSVKHIIKWLGLWCLLLEVRFSCNPLITYTSLQHADNNQFTFTLTLHTNTQRRLYSSIQNINIFTFVRKTSRPVFYRCPEFHFVFCGLFLSYFTLTHLVCLFCMFPESLLSPCPQWVICLSQALWIKQSGSGTCALQTVRWVFNEQTRNWHCSL